MSGKFGNADPRPKSVEWYTPGWIFEMLEIDFDLDPASPHDMESLVPAKTKYTIFDDGLAKDWYGRVFLNPPYGKETAQWMERMIEHGNGIALVFSRTDAKWFQSALRSASAILFVSGRIQFIPGLENQTKKSRCVAGTAIFAFGDECVSALKRLADMGYLVIK